MRIYKRCALQPATALRSSVSVRHQPSPIKPSAIGAGASCCLPYHRPRLSPDPRAERPVVEIAGCGRSFATAIRCNFSSGRAIFGCDRDGRARYCGATGVCRISDLSKYAPNLPDVSNCFIACRRPPATLHGVVFDILGARAVTGECSNVVPECSALSRTLRVRRDRGAALADDRARHTRHGGDARQNRKKP